jgi:hypothetical protein
MLPAEMSEANDSAAKTARFVLSDGVVELNFTQPLSESAQRAAIRPCFQHVMLRRRTRLIANINRKLFMYSPTHF